MARSALRRPETAPATSPEALVSSLQHLRAAYRAGELTEAEFSRERLLLLDRRRAQIEWEGEERRTAR